MVNMLASDVVDCGLDHRLGLTKNIYTCICFLSVKHGALRSKTENWLALCQDNVSHILDHIT